MLRLGRRSGVKKAVDRADMRDRRLRVDKTTNVEHRSPRDHSHNERFENVFDYERKQ
jgi:hypothetical protein